MRECLATKIRYLEFNLGNEELFLTLKIRAVGACMALSKTRGDPSRRSHPCVQLSDLGSNVVGRDLDSAGTHADHRDSPSVK